MSRTILVILALGLLMCCLPACSRSGDDDDTSRDDDGSPDDDDNDNDNDDASPDDDDNDASPSDDDDASPTDDDDDVSPAECVGKVDRQPYLQSVTQTSVRVMWETDWPGDSFVEFGPTASLGQTAGRDERELLHVVDLTGLQPQTTYYYKARSCKDETTVASFRTAPLRDTPFNFVAWCDNHCHAEIFGPLVQYMIALDPDFAFSSGDTLDSGWDTTQFDRCFFTPAQELFRSAPIYVAFGNHEAFSVPYYSLFSFPGGHNPFFSFTYGNTFFIGLDSDVPYIPGLPWYKWLVEQLTSTEATQAEFRLMFFHHPPYTEGWPGYDGDPIVREFILPLMEENHVDAYFNGHTHDYERGWNKNVANYIIGGAGGDLDDWARDVPWDLYYAKVHMFLHISVDGKTMTIDAIGTDGQTFDTFQIVH